MGDGQDWGQGGSAHTVTELLKLHVVTLISHGRDRSRGGNRVTYCHTVLTEGRGGDGAVCSHTMLRGQRIGVNGTVCSHTILRGQRVRVGIGLCTLTLCSDRGQRAGVGMGLYAVILSSHRGQEVGMGLLAVTLCLHKRGRGRGDTEQLWIGGVAPGPT